MAPIASLEFVRKLGWVCAISTWLIPIAAVSNLFWARPETISPAINAVMWFYSSVYIRWSLAVTPPNYPLLACHLVNITAQAFTTGRYIKFRRLQKQLEAPKKEKEIKL